MGLFGKSKKERETEYMSRLDVPSCLKEDFELIIDDIFTIMGVGTVATGNILTKLLGVSISKKFIPSIANIVGTDLSNYKIVRTGQFAYGPVTSRNGEKISIAYLDEEDCIISSSYTVFEVENKEELDPEYLMLWFSRPEFDRYARYKSHGSVREIFDWNELCMVELPVPDIEKQRKIVKAYKTITDRIDLKQKINDNLAA